MTPSSSTADGAVRFTAAPSAGGSFEPDLVTSQPVDEQEAALVAAAKRRPSRRGTEPAADEPLDGEAS